MLETFKDPKKIAAAVLVTFAATIIINKLLPYTPAVVRDLYAK